MPSEGFDALSLVLFLIAVIIVSFMVHILCQNHKLNREKQLSSEKISRLFDHAVVRPARQAKTKTTTEPLESFGLNCIARGAFEAFERIYEGSNPSLADIVGLELDVVNDNLNKHEDQLRATLIYENDLP